MDKYEYLTVEELGLKPSSVEKAKFDYSPLGKIYNKRRRLKEEDEKEGLLKRLKNIENKNEEQLRAVKNKTNHKRSHWLCQRIFKFGSKGVNSGN